MRGFVKGFWPGGTKGRAALLCSIRRAGETEGLEMAAGI